MPTSSKTKFFKGIYTAIITPFTSDGDLNFIAFERLVQRQIDAKVSGIVVCGSTGENPTLNEEEKIQLFRNAVALCEKKIQVIAGTGLNDTKATIALNSHAEKTGVDGTLVVTPYYNKPTPNGLLAHFKVVANSTSLPIIMYNVPSRTGVSLNTATISELANHKNISGIKEATGDLTFFKEIRESVLRAGASEFSFLTGDDLTYLPALRSGADGNISVASNVIPKTMVHLQEIWNKKADDAERIFSESLPFFESLFLESNPLPVKALLHELKLCEEVFRLPLVPITKDNREKLLEVWSKQKYKE